MRRSLGCLIVVLVLAGALAGCQTTVDRPEPPSPAEVSSAKGSMEADAESPGGQQIDLSGSRRLNYSDVKEAQRSLDEEERKLLEEHVAKAISDFQDKGSGKLRAMLEGVRKARDDGYDLTPLCNPNVRFDDFPNEHLLALYEAGQNEYTVRFDIPAFARSSSCPRQDVDIAIWVYVTAARVRKTVNKFRPEEIIESVKIIADNLDPKTLSPESVCPTSDEDNKDKCRGALGTNSSVESVALVTTNKEVKTSVELEVSKEVLLNYYMLERDGLLTKGTFLYYPPDSDGNQVFSLHDDADAQAIETFQDQSVTVSMWEVIDDFIRNGNRKSNQLESAQELFDEFDRDSKQAITCIDPQDPKTVTRRIASGLRSSNTGAPSPSKLMKSVVYIRNSGTGFYIRDDLVLTNHHVIENSLIVEMRTQDDRSYFKGVVIGYDARRDLALVKAQQDGTAMVIHNGSLPNLGDEVSAYGHPVRRKFTYTRGVISNNDVVVNIRWPDLPVKPYPNRHCNQPRQFRRAIGSCWQGHRHQYMDTKENKKGRP